MKALNTLKRAALTALALAVLAGSAGVTAARAADGRRDSNRGRDQKQERTVRQQKPDRTRKDDRAVQSRDRRQDQRKDSAVRGRDRDHRRDRSDDRAVRNPDRDRHDNRVVVRHRSVVRHRDLRACPPPRYLARPWYGQSRRIYVHDDPFYFHAGLGIYLGGLALRLELGDVPPLGFVYYDPYCDERFWSVEDYRFHLRYHHHPQALTVIVLDGYYLDD